MFFYSISSGLTPFEKESMVIGHHKSFSETAFAKIYTEAEEKYNPTSKEELIQILYSKYGFKRIRSKIDVNFDDPKKSFANLESFNRKYGFIYGNKILTRTFYTNPFSFLEKSYEDKLGYVESADIIKSLVDSLGGIPIFEVRQISPKFEDNTIHVNGDWELTKYPDDRGIKSYLKIISVIQDYPPEAFDAVVDLLRPFVEYKLLKENEGEIR